MPQLEHTRLFPYQFLFTLVYWFNSLSKEGCCSGFLRLSSILDSVMQCSISISLHHSQTSIKVTSFMMNEIYEKSYCDESYQDNLLHIDFFQTVLLCCIIDYLSASLHFIVHFSRQITISSHCCSFFVRQQFVDDRLPNRDLESLEDRMPSSENSRGRYVISMRSF